MNKPIIGIISRCDEEPEFNRPIQYVFDGVRNSIIDSGGVPFILSPFNSIDYYHTKFNEMPDFTIEELKLMDKFLSMCDGLFIPGGYKYTKFDIKLIEMALEKDMPILGVCLGMQVMASIGKDNFKPIKIESDINHRQEYDEKYCHLVKINKDSMLYNIVKQEEFMVNSFHRMQVEENSLYKTTGYSEDGVIESIEMPNKKYVIGVQWHPEKMLDYDKNARLIMNSFIDASLDYKLNRNDNVVRV